MGDEISHKEFTKDDFIAFKNALEKSAILTLKKNKKLQKETSCYKDYKIL